MKNVNEEPRKIIYEWVLTMTRGESIIFTERQYEFYKEHFKESKIFFDEIEINPAYVVSAEKNIASEWLKNKYPCPRCHQSGHDPDDRSFWCKDCGGAGLSLPSK